MKRNLSDLDATQLKGQVVLVRSDLNVPLEDGRVTDDQRIRASLPTFRLLLKGGARVVVLSHLGRPKGMTDARYSLSPVAERLSEHLGRSVRFIPEVVGAEVSAAVAEMEDGDIVLLENTRFLPGDTANDAELSAAWAGLGSIFVNDAFGTAHRAHASTSGLAEAMLAKGGQALAGLLLQRELRYLQEALADPERPFIAILGGAKISGKIDVIAALLPKVDRLLIGGAMANTFFKAIGLEVGASLVEDDRLDMARERMAEGGDRLVLPVDCVLTREIAPAVRTWNADRERVQEGDRIADIGLRTRTLYAELLADARTVVWNGPMGVFEIDAFAEGTESVADALADACDRGALGIIGGGDSAAAAVRMGVAGRISHISTGGGASLDLLSGADLPGVTSLSED
jgi:3-phosphoglycerate kinase